jgi:FkbM family methyltransferase
MLPYLRQNRSVLKDIEIAETFVGEQDGTFNYALEHAPGSASISKNAQTASSIPISTIATILAKHPRFRNAKFLKIDTDGFDAQVLRAATPLLSSAKPVILFEFAPHLLRQQGEDIGSIFPSLKRLGYESFAIYDNFGNFLVSTDSDDALADIVSYYNFVPGPEYCDVIAFHIEDADIHQEFRVAERNRCRDTRREFTRTRNRNT